MDNNTQKVDPEVQAFIDVYKGKIGGAKTPEELQTTVAAYNGKLPEEKIPAELQASIDAYKAMTAGQTRTLKSST